MNKPDSTAPRMRLSHHAGLALACIPPFNERYLRQSTELVRNARRIVAVCRGNTCRSPFLEGCLKESAARHGIALPPVISRGLSAKDGERSSQTAIESARGFSVDLSSHAAKSILDEQPDPADVYLVMNPTHAAELMVWFGSENIHLIYVGLLCAENRKPIVVDPFGGDLKTYDRTYAVIQRATDRLLTEFKRLR
jgi:protein-tyrosine-phosphatase